MDALDVDATDADGEQVVHGHQPSNTRNEDARTPSRTPGHTPPAAENEQERDAIDLNSANGDRDDDEDQGDTPSASSTTPFLMASNSQDNNGHDSDAAADQRTKNPEIFLAYRVHGENHLLVDFDRRRLMQVARRAGGKFSCFFPVRASNIRLELGPLTEAGDFFAVATVLLDHVEGNRVLLDGRFHELVPQETTFLLRFVDDRRRPFCQIFASIVIHMMDGA